MRTTRTVTAALAIVILYLIGGCGKPNPLKPETTITTNPPVCDTCPPCPECPPDTIDHDTTLVEVASYATASVRIHEAQSHATLAAGVWIPAGTILKLRIPVEYENGRSQQNENFHVYVRSVTNFTQKFDFIWDSGTTEVVPDPAGFSGWLTRALHLVGVPSGSYDVVIQQDLPNHYSPGESDIRIGAGVLTVYSKK